MSTLIAAYTVSALAGALSTLSPCVLPLVPILMGSAVAAHRLGTGALAAGVAVSFTVVGVAVATIGTSLGLDGDTIRTVGAAVMVGIGVLLMSHQLQQRFALLSSGATSGGHALLSRITTDGLPGQFLLGLLLGIVWTPCVGPTLGAAVTLASQRRDLASVAAQMAFFGLGASAPMLLIGSLSHAALARSKGTLRIVAEHGKRLLGATLVGLGLLILTGADRSVEVWLVDHSPSWLTQLTTSL